MKKRSATASRILDAGREMFNHKGYAATSVTEIAASLGMSQGNLTYHFPTKRDLAMAIENDLLQLMKARRIDLKPGPLVEDYIEHLVFGMQVIWRYRFVMRDRMHYADKPIGQRSDSELTADYNELRSLLERMWDEGLFISDDRDTLETLSRSLWIVSRYWIDCLRELEGKLEVSWSEQERGIQHHLAVLLPLLKESARKDFQAALDRRQS